LLGEQIRTGQLLVEHTEVLVRRNEREKGDSAAPAERVYVEITGSPDTITRTRVAVPGNGDMASD
jgi:hypothetical protein